jgi:hypothetical protein
MIFKIILFIFLLIIIYEYLLPKNTYVKKSKINGTGLFAAKNFEVGDIILENVFPNKPKNKSLFNPIKKNMFDKYISYEGTQVNHCTYYHNSDLHSEDFKLFQLIATQKIKKGSEITANYDKINQKMPFIAKSQKHYQSC